VTPYDPDPLQVTDAELVERALNAVLAHRGAQDRRRSLLSRLVAVVKGWLGR
jgi:hypothetical protein